MSINSALSNRILSALPAADLKRLSTHLEPVSLANGEVLYTRERSITQVYFPTTCLISLVALLNDGTMVEAGMVGHEGVLGVPIILGVSESSTEAMVQSPGEAMRMSAASLRSFIAQDGVLNKLLLRYIHSLLAQIVQTAACNRVHTLNERLARWLLLTHDRVNSDRFELTHEFLATMLGTRRAGVSVAAKALKDAGLIDYSRGHLRILDRSGLENASCECYSFVHNTFESPLNLAS